MIRLFKMLLSARANGPVSFIYKSVARTDLMNMEISLPGIDRDCDPERRPMILRSYMGNQLWCRPLFRYHYGGQSGYGCRNRCHESDHDPNCHKNPPVVDESCVRASDSTTCGDPVSGGHYA